MIKTFYAEQAKKHLLMYQQALDDDDRKTADYHQQEYLTYDEASKK